MSSIKESFAGKPVYTQAHHTTAGETRAVLIGMQPHAETQEQHWWLCLFTSTSYGNYGPCSTDRVKELLLAAGVPVESGWIQGEAPAAQHT